MKATILAIITGLSLLFFTSCSEKTTDQSSSNSGQPSSTLETIILKEEPAEAINVAEARQDPTPGKKVVVKAKVIGHKSPIVEGLAVVIVGDPDKLVSCDLLPGDGCETPWDVCCEESENIKANTATVQVLDNDGKRIKESLRGVGGLKELTYLTIAGVIDEKSTKDNLIINATGIYIKP